MEGVALARSRVGLRRARRLREEVEFRDSGDGMLFSEVCLGIVRNIRASFEVAVE